MGAQGSEPCERINSHGQMKSRRGTQKARTSALPTPETPIRSVAMGLVDRLIRRRRITHHYAVTRDEPLREVCNQARFFEGDFRGVSGCLLRWQATLPIT